jgi:glycosyltransferase involved in cell wall biosynthesis
MQGGRRPGTEKTMAKVLFVHNQLTRFVRADLDLLRERHAVTERHEPRPLALRPLAIRRAVRQHDLVFAWFASWHSLLPVLAARRLGVPSVAVVGGYDTARVPEANYGSQRGGLRRIVSRAVIRRATRLITNSEAAREEAVANAGADRDRITVLYHGVDPAPDGGADAREPLVLTVGNVWRENLLRKGLLPFVQAAAHLPGVRFVHAGRWCDDAIDDLRRAAGPNVQFRGFVSDDELFRLYARASVYVQASLHEGFGLSVAEAMSAGCVPVVTRAGSLPEVAGETGVYAESTDPAELARAVRRALELGGDRRRQARTRVVEMFSMGQRRTGLHELVESVLSPAGCLAPNA